jgi:hypothetical protein
MFFTTGKNNRQVRLGNPDHEIGSSSGYSGLTEIDWTPERIRDGVVVRLQKVPFPVRLFKIVSTNGDIDWIITNNLDSSMTAQVAQDANDGRWDVEEFHRGLKQLTGSEQGPCRAGRSQRNHIACCYQAWLSLKVKAFEFGKTL